MFCNKCGNELPKGSLFCPKCGNRTMIESEKGPEIPGPIVKEPESPETQPPVESKGGSICPKCGSHNCEIQVQQNVSGGSSYSAGLGCLGFLLTGPFGILCGLCGGSKATTTHRSMWVCKNCGHQFRPKADAIKSVKMLCLMPLVTFAIEIVLFLLLSPDSFVSAESFIAALELLLPPVIVVSAVCFFGIKSILNEQGYAAVKDFFKENNPPHLK